jgi:CRP-like cAMP-binding protein
MSVDAARVRRVPLFADLSEDQIMLLARCFEERHVQVGDRLASEGGAGYFFFVIDSGSAEVSRGDNVLATFGPGDFFGEAAIFETLRRTATVTATSPSTVLAMFGADFSAVASQVPELKQKIDAAIAARLPPEP